MDLRDYIKGAKLKPIIYVLVITIFYLIWLFPLEHAINKFFNAEQIANIFKNKVPLNTQISALSYTTNPDFTITITSPHILIADNNSEIVDIKNFSLKTNPFYLIFNKFFINELNANSLNLNIIKNKNGQLNILELLPKNNSKKIQIKKINTSISSYKILYLDEIINEKVLLEGNNFKIIDYIPNKKIQISTNGVINTSTKNSRLKNNSSYDLSINSKLPYTKNVNKKDFNLNIKFKNLNLKQLKPFIQEYTKISDIKELNGIINIDVETQLDENAQKKKIIGKIDTQDILIKENSLENTTQLTGKTNIDFILSLLENKIEINNFKIKKEKDLSVNILGEILQITSTKPFINISMNFINDKKDMFYNFLPSEIKYEHYLIKKLKKYKPIGTLNGDLKIVGFLPNPEITGEIKSDNLIIDSPDTKKAKASVSIIFDKKRLKILGNVKTNNASSVDVNGALNIYGEKNAVFDIKSNNEVELPLINAVLIPIQDIFTLNFGVINQLIIDKGLISGALHVSGTRKNSNAIGKLNFHNAVASFNGIDAQISNGEGFIEFKGRELEYETTSAYIDNQPIKIRGVGNLLGGFDIDLSSDFIRTQKLLYILKNSELLREINEKNKEINLISKIKGNSSLYINLNGTGELSKNSFNIDKINYKGELKLKNNIVTIESLLFPVNISNAKLNFDNKEIKSVINAKILNSLIDVDTILKNDNLKLNAKSDKFLLSDIFILFDKKGEYKKLFSQNKNSSFTKFIASYEGKLKDIELDKIVLNATLFSDGIDPFYAAHGVIKLHNKKVDIENVNLNILESQTNINGAIENIFNKETNYSIDCDISNFNIAKLNNITKYKIIKDDVKKIISAYENYSGKINGILNFQKNKINGNILIRDIALTHKKLQLPISVSSADVIFKDTDIFIPKIHGTVDDLPVLIKFDIHNFIKNPTYNGYITTNLYPSFVNKYINPNLGYPIKLKGEMQFKSYFNGSIDNITATTLLNFPVNSDISYMGASIDDKEFERELKIEMTQNKNIFKINKAVISKYIRAQNGGKLNYPYVKANGIIKILPKDIEFKNLNIKTHEQTNSKIFNILFKKSILKYGKFDCNLTLNGTYTKPVIHGFINFKNLDMPLYETIVKDIFTEFKPNTIDLKILGSVYDTDIVGTAILKNDLSLPYHIKNLNIKADYLDIDNIFNSISTVSLKNPHDISANQNNDSKNILDVKPNYLIIDNGIVNAKKVLVRGFPATDLEAKISLGQNNILNVHNFNFKFGEGSVKTKGLYNFNNNILEGNCIAKSIDANSFAQIFLNLKNQIYGNLDGVVDFSTTGVTPNQRLENLNAQITFDIRDGKMPKLGSLEYLLRAANLVKSGITGFTINNMINLLVPVKTGNFMIINGDIDIENGIAKNIEIMSKGKNLSLYITGTADIIKQNAQMVVLGKLTKKLSTILGPIGNTSLNTLFNFIPGVSIDEQGGDIIKELSKIPVLELSDNNEYRFFKATIDGDLNSEEFVQTFKWLE